jgi:uncharacterized membrane protein
VNLRPAGDPRLHVESAPLPLVVLVDLVTQGRARTDDRHVALDDVPELWQLVDRQPSQRAAGSRDARVAPVHRRTGSERLGAHDHRAKLEQLEVDAVLPDPCLTIEHGAAVIELDCDRGEREDGTRDDEARACDRDVENAVHTAERSRDNDRIAGLPAWSRLRPNPWATAACVGAVLYGGVLAWASIARHDAFGSGYDVAIFDQAVWLLGHGHDPFSTIRGRELFGDHFQPALAILAPLGTLNLTPVALLVLQAALLAAAAPALYLLARGRGAAQGLALAVALLWLASPLTQWANLFEFHPESAAPLLFVLGAFWLERGRIAPFVVTAVLASSLKEDVCLVYLMWGLILVFGRERRLGVLLAAGATAWFVLATEVAIPAFGGSLSYYAARFGGERGSSVGGVLVSVVRHPLTTVADTATYPNAKLVLALVACTGGLALLAPRMLILGLPAVAANVFSAYPYQHDLHFQYQLVPAGVFALASAYGAGAASARLSSPLVRGATAVLLVGAAAAAAFAPAVKELRRTARVDGGPKGHALALIPPGVPVAAGADLTPHLANRRDIYQLPEPFVARPTNGEYWSSAELARRTRRVQYVAYDTAGLEPSLLRQVELLPPLLRRRGFVEVWRDGDVRVFRRR